MSAISNKKSRIQNLIAKNSEGDYWDFKQKWHKDNERLLHDILCFSNTVHERDCYIIIGVSDSGEVVGVNEGERMKQASILDLLSNTVFAGDNTPEIKVDTFKIEDKEIDVLTVFNSYNVPFYLKNKSKKYSHIKEGYIYTRVGDKNTPINQNATIQQIEMLWKKRLGLTQPPLTQIVSRLESKLDWIENNGTFYNVFKPEFKLVEEFTGDEYIRRKGEFYVYSQTNSEFSYETLKVMYNQTVLEEFQLVILDSGRYKTPIPEWGQIGQDKTGANFKYTYKYYLKDSIAYKLQQFFFDCENEEEVYAKRDFDEVVLYFENNKEKLAFEYYVEINQRTFEAYINKMDKVYFTIDASNEREIRNIKHRLSVGLALNKILQEFKGE
ncbi:AlbA family DNA-binding domain-containing protein [Priestia megaterium]|uniref:AlbA family DNA-binding domain-containing protein n=1 Tax=Priestia megaterium TaxID=1404 RepID=UPI001E3085EF|nr:ATP-binding protein [Priestia megaterium]